MEFNIQKEQISFCTQHPEGSAEQAIDCDITLPDYLPDIVRILRCSCIPGIRSCRTVSDRLTAECGCTVRVLYVCDEGKIHCFEQNLQFSKQIEIKNPDGSGEYFTGIKTDYVNHRASGQRRIEIHGAVTVFVEAHRKKTDEIITDATGCGITLQSESLPVCNTVSVAERIFTITETCDASSLGEAVSGVISANASAVIEQLKIVSDKLFLKGQLIVNSAFIGAESGSVYTLQNGIELNQITEAAEIDESCRVESSLSVINLEVKPRTDSSGDKSLVDVSATLSLSVRGYENRTLRCVTDAYSVLYETECSRGSIYVSSIEDEIDDTFLCRGEAELSATGISRVLSLECSEITSSFSVGEDALIIGGEVTADILFCDARGEVSFTRRNLPYEYKRNSTVTDGRIVCNPHCAVTASSFILCGENKLDIRAEINVTGFVFCEKEQQTVSSITVNCDKQKSVTASALTVYFAEKGEPLWNIAEKYNTTVDAIIRENAMTEACIREKCKLLIPRV